MAWLRALCCKLEQRVCGRRRCARLIVGPSAREIAAQPHIVVHVFSLAPSTFVCHCQIHRLFPTTTLAAANRLHRDLLTLESSRVGALASPFRASPLSSSAPDRHPSPALDAYKILPSLQLGTKMAKSIEVRLRERGGLSAMCRWTGRRNSRVLLVACQGLYIGLRGGERVQMRYSIASSSWSRGLGQHTRRCGRSSHWNCCLRVCGRRRCCARCAQQPPQPSRIHPSTPAPPSPQKQQQQRLPEPLLDENPDRYCMFPIK